MTTLISLNIFIKISTFPTSLDKSHKLDERDKYFKIQSDDGEKVFEETYIVTHKSTTMLDHKRLLFSTIFIHKK